MVGEFHASFFLCSSLVLRCDPPHSTSSFLLRRRRRRCPKATRGGPRRPDAKKNFLRFSFFKKTPPPSLFGTVSSAGERIHQSCSNPVSVLSLDIVGSHRVRQIPNSPIRGNQAELKATTEEERMDYFCKARPPNFFSPLPFPAFPGIRLILEVGVVALGAWRQEVFFSIHDPLSRRYT